MLWQTVVAHDTGEEEWNMKLGRHYEGADCGKVEVERVVH